LGVEVDAGCGDLDELVVFVEKVTSFDAEMLVEPSDRLLLGILLIICLQRYGREECWSCSS
jgi:hypothetical protein